MIRRRQRRSRGLRHTFVEERERLLELCIPDKPSNYALSERTSRQVHNTYQRFALQNEIVSISYIEQASRYEDMSDRRTFGLHVQ